MRAAALAGAAWLTAAAGLGHLAMGQADRPGDRPGGMDKPVGGRDDLPAVSEPGAATGASDLEELLKGLSPDEVEKLIQTAIEARLRTERQQVAEEIREGLLYDPQDTGKAVKILEDRPANTQKDNIDRVIRAFAAVDLHLAKALKLLEAKKHAEAADAIKKDLNVQEATYLNAARYTVYARALAAGGKGYDAVEAYQQILVAMPDRVSFAAAAALDSARIYEQLQRFGYAGQMYKYAVANYGLTLDKAELEAIYGKLTEFEKFQRDPLGVAGGLMGEVKNRLRAADSGKETQKKEDQIVAVITDLIKTAEEQQQSGGQSPQRQQGQRQGEGQSQGQAQGQAQGQPPQGTQQPSNPAQVSALVPGAVARPTRLSEVHNTAESGDWANLPPRERQRLEQLRSKIMSERYRDLISDYRAKVAERRGP